jgi:hypothetical protein
MRYKNDPFFGASGSAVGLAQVDASGFLLLVVEVIHRRDDKLGDDLGTAAAAAVHRNRLTILGR